ncbi:MAG: dicarboxylate/amino acid:cation symporter [Schwartzia succinivorans]|nr:dicarboxylate/amino acid:cation symporter [Schwartzia succinivorans]
MIQTYTITAPEYGKVVDWLEEILAGMKVTRREIFVAELLLEENFYRLAEASGDASSFSARLDIRKRFGDVDLRLSAHGEPFNPLEELNEATEDTAELYSLAILKAHRDKISHSWKKGENVISMRIHRSDSKTAVHTLIALVLGVVLGVAMKAGLGAETIRWVGDNLFLPVETIFMNALLMVAAPLIFFSVTAGITGMSDTADIGRMGGKLLMISLAKLAIMLVLAVFLGIRMGAMPELLAMDTVNAASGGATVSVRDVIMSIVPKNIIAPFEGNNLLQVLFLALFFGMLLAKAAERAAWVRDFVSFCNRFFTDAMGTILPLMPVVVAVSMAKLMMNTELTVLLLYGRIIGGAFVELLLVLTVCAVFVTVVGRLSPAPFLRKFLTFSILPFSLRSSNGCLPDTLNFCSKKLGMEKKVAMFSVPVGIQFNMMGSGSYVVMLAILLRLTVGRTVDAEFLLSFFFAVLLLAFTFPSVPGATILVMASVFGMAGVPASAVTLFIGIDPLIDGFRTVANVAGNTVSSLLLARTEGKVDEEVYRAD